MILLYISVDNFITASFFIAGVWVNRSTFFNQRNQLRGSPAVPNSASLAAIAFPKVSGSNKTNALIVFEESKGVPTLLLGTSINFGLTNPWSWNNISATAKNATDSTLGVPFVTYPHIAYNGSWVLASFLTSKPKSPSTPTVMSLRFEASGSVSWWSKHFLHIS